MQFRPSITDRDFGKSKRFWEHNTRKLLHALKK